ncbi:pyridoxal-phosphate dependent enzyme, partial [Acinetobacter baumannii]
MKIEPVEPTVMAMLECYEPSMLAWGILSRLAEAYMTVRDADAIAAMKQLARAENGRSRVVAGESGGAGLAGLLAAASDPQSRALLGLD